MTGTGDTTKKTLQVLGVSTPSQICAVDSVTGQPVYMTAMWFSNTVSEVQSALANGFSSGSGTCIGINWYTGYSTVVGAKAIGYQDAYISTTSSSYIQIPMVKIPQVGSISFASTPPGAEIFLDGTDQGVKTPNTISNVPVGTHTFTLKLAGYNDYTGSVSVILNQIATGSATLIPTCVPSWQCESPLNGYENDGCGNRRLNSACNPAPPIGQCISSWQCEMPLNGYENDGCGNRRLNSACNPAPPGAATGSVSFISSPSGAKIFIDGADQGAVTPYVISNIPVGSHTFTLKRTGYNDISGTVSVVQGQTASIPAALVPSAAAQKVTTGAKVVIGAMAVGTLAVLGYMFLRKKPPTNQEFLKYPPGGP